MTDDLQIDNDSGIGVGMGGSCPNCRAPVDLGQEFCLECGAPIRFSRKQKSRRTDAGTGAVAPGTPRGTVIVPAHRGFPWVPFLIVLVLVIGGLVFALVSSGGESPSSKATTRDNSLSAITNERPDTSDTKTTTVADCNVDGTSNDGGIALPSDAGQNASGVPQLSDPTDPLPDPNAIPQLGPDGTTGSSGVGAGTALPSDGEQDGDTVTVDQNGNLCPTTDAGDTSGDPYIPPTTTDQGGTATPPSTTTTDPVNTPTTPTSNATSWPAGKSGFTAIVKGLKKSEGYTRQDANQQAAQLQADGLEGGVLDSDEYASLCPGFWVVFSGVFTTNAQAEARIPELSQAGYRGAYARPINQTGSCTRT